MYDEGERRRRLRALFLSLFAWEHLRIFLSDYAGPTVVRAIEGDRGAQQLAFEAIEQLAFHGLIVEALFMQLCELFPMRRDDIMHAAADWGIGSGTMLPIQGLEALHRALIVQREPAAAVRCIAENFASYFKAMRGELLSYTLAATLPEAGAFVVELWLELPPRAEVGAPSVSTQREPPKLEDVSASSELLFEEDIELLGPSEPPLVTEPSELSATATSWSVVAEPVAAPTLPASRGWTMLGAGEGRGADGADARPRQRISSQCYVLLPRHEQVGIFRCLHELMNGRRRPYDAAAYLTGVPLPPDIEHVHCFMGDRRKFSYELALTWEQTRREISKDVSLATMQSLFLELTRRAIGSERLVPRASPLTEFLGLR